MSSESSVAARPSRPPLSERLRAAPWGWIGYGACALLAVLSVVSDSQTILARADLSVPGKAGAITAWLLVLACMGLAARLPRWSVAAGIAATVVSLLPWVLPPGLFALVIIVFLVALRADAAAAVAVGAAIVLWLGVTAYRRPEIFGAMAWLLSSLIIVVALVGWSLGVSLRRRDAAERRAASLEGQAARVRERERQVLARELHDVVAHGLTLISMQATVMRIATKPEQLETARAAIERSSRESLEELKRLLQVLRASDVITDDASALRGASADDGAGLAEVVARLADDLRGVGHSVEAVCEVGTVPHSVELAADRVLREAMTNIVKHGGASTSCTLSVREVTGWLEIDVANEVRAERLADLGSTRLGIVGLAERVELLGGSLDAGLDGGRWRVRVRLPLL